MKKLLILITLGTLLLSCGNNNNLSNSNNTNNDVSSSNDISKKEILITSIPPLKWLVQKIAGDNFEVISIIQPNMNHELFDPKPNDLKALENSKLFFTYNILS
ncbi:MAG: zinc ABC transporter substrate-binding protein, partial [Leptotrichiaceae bacterium]|nr:zinc ABC transporter substrate-binding protein [Leptotrichiaceae bacterium]